MNSSQDEKAASALQAMKLDNDVNGLAVQVRVTQNNEPRHFLKMFQGNSAMFYLIRFIEDCKQDMHFSNQLIIKNGNLGRTVWIRSRRHLQATAISELLINCLY